MSDFKNYGPPVEGLQERVDKLERLLKRLKKSTGERDSDHDHFINDTTTQLLIEINVLKEQLKVSLERHTACHNILEGFYPGSDSEPKTDQGKDPYFNIKGVKSKMRFSQGKG